MGEIVEERQLDDAALRLADPELHGMYAVGAVHTGTTTLPLPAGLDVGSYPVVDVSVEPFDGDPAHSADSVARGRLSG